MTSSSRRTFQLQGSHHHQVARRARRTRCLRAVPPLPRPCVAVGLEYEQRARSFPATAAESAERTAGPAPNEQRCIRRAADARRRPRQAVRRARPPAPRARLRPLSRQGRPGGWSGDKVTWSLFRWVWRLEGSLHVGMLPAGSLNRTRLYVPSRAFRGALTAELSRREARDGKAWHAWLPTYREGLGLAWARQDHADGPVGGRNQRSIQRLGHSEPLWQPGSRSESPRHWSIDPEGIWGMAP